MTTQYIIASGFALVFAALLIALNVAGYRERQRRKRLPKELREALDRQDHKWLSDYQM